MWLMDKYYNIPVNFKYGDGRGITSSLNIARPGPVFHIFLCGGKKKGLVALPVLKLI